MLGYLLLAFVLVALGTALLFASLFASAHRPVYPLMAIALVLFLLPAARIVNLGWKTLRIDDQSFVKSAPFWFSTTIERSTIVNVDVVQTDSIEVESLVGRGFEKHCTTRATVSRIALALAGFVRFWSRIFDSGSIGAMSTTRSPAALLALRFWLRDGSRIEVLIPDKEKKRAAIASAVLALAPHKDSMLSEKHPDRSPKERLRG